MLKTYDLSTDITFRLFHLVTLSLKDVFFLLDDNSVWYMDLKNGAGGCGQGPPPQEADVRLVLFFSFRVWSCT
jgi:hypothetical protein